MVDQENKKCDRLLDTIWPRIREKHLFPELPKPEISTSMGEDALSIKNRKIRLNLKFLEEHSRHLPMERVVEALLDHGVAHYTVCPWDLYTYLTLYKSAMAVLNDKGMALTATSYFMDVIVDTHCFEEKKSPVAELYFHIEKRETLEKVMHALYQRIWGVYLNVQGHDAITTRLAQIPYLNKRRWPQSLRRFSMIIRDILTPAPEARFIPMGRFGFGHFSQMELDQAIEKFIMLSKNPQEFQELIEDLPEDLLENVDSEGGIGFSFGRRCGDGNAMFYMRMAENYALPLNGKPTEKSGTMYPFTHSPWEMGKPFLDIDPWTSLGKIMPGLTQTWQRREGDLWGTEEGTPNCLIIIDSSGSMVNPKDYLSQAVLGASCAADAYLKNDAMVAVYNFSDTQANQRVLLPYTRQRLLIYQALCHYFGGGTVLDLEDIETLRDPSVPDIFVITDMKISNLNDFIVYLNGLENRVTAVHIGKSDHAERFRQAVEARENGSIFFVQRSEDIPKIVLGRIGEYFGASSKTGIYASKGDEAKKPYQSF